MVFDVLHVDGSAVRQLPYAQRREVLEQLLGDGPSWRVPRRLEAPLDAALAVTRSHGLEGIVAKRLDAPYQPGRRAAVWLKHKHRRRERFMVTGWAPAARGTRRPDTFFVA